MSDYTINTKEIENAFRTIVGGDIAECRAIRVHEKGKNPFIARGWFGNGKILADAVSKPESDAFYITLNPVKTELMKRSNSKFTKARHRMTATSSAGCGC